MYKNESNVESQLIEEIAAIIHGCNEQGFTVSETARRIVNHIESKGGELK